MKKVNYKLTISIDKKVIDEFKVICDANGLKLGKQIELLIRNKLVEKDVKRSNHKP